MLTRLSKTGNKMTEKKPPLPRLRDLAPSPVVNPFLETTTVPIKKRHVRAARGKDLLDTATGEVSGFAAIHTVEYKDDAEFVKVFADGVRAAFDLDAPGNKVFRLVLQEYEATAMSYGFADTLTLFWLGEGLNGSPCGMSESTFNRGLRELVSKKFLYPRSPSSYWVNPALFFKGDRVAFIKEYRRKAPTPAPKAQQSLNLESTES
jgi:hypothetical protein